MKIRLSFVVVFPVALGFYLHWALEAREQGKDLRDVKKVRAEITMLWNLWSRNQESEGEQREKISETKLAARTLDGAADWRYVSDWKTLIRPDLWVDVPLEDPWGTEYQWLLTDEGLAVRSAGKDLWFFQGRYNFGRYSFQDDEIDPVLWSGNWYQVPAFPVSRGWLDEHMVQKARKRQGEKQQKAWRQKRSD